MLAAGVGPGARRAIRRPSTRSSPVTNSAVPTGRRCFRSAEGQQSPHLGPPGASPQSKVSVTGGSGTLENSALLAVGRHGKVPCPSVTETLGRRIGPTVANPVYAGEPLWLPPGMSVSREYT
jgi:hypothetical protein